MEPLDLPTEAVQDTEVPSPDPVEVFQATGRLRAFVPMPMMVTYPAGKRSKLACP